MNQYKEKFYFKSNRVSGSAIKAVGLIVPIIMLFYLVLYLKEIGFTYEIYFSDYDNAVTVWTVGFDFFTSLLNTLDNLTSVLGKIIEFIVNSIDAVITWVTDRINQVVSVVSGSWFERLAEWFKTIAGHIIFL